MAILDTFSKRQRRLEHGASVDPYVYDSLPLPLRVQVVRIVQDALGEDRTYGGPPTRTQFYDHVNSTMSREFGWFSLGERSDSNERAVNQFIQSAGEVYRVLDVVEYSFRVLDQHVRRIGQHGTHNRPLLKVDEAIADLNHRFFEQSVGYQFVGGDIVRVDSQLMHAEVVLPALHLLSESRFSNANDEFLLGHEHYRHGRYKECMVACLASFESTMKVVCKARSWDVDQNAAAKALINVCIANGLFPDFMEAQLHAARGTLESGIPTVRNKLGGHGQGTVRVDVQPHFARFALNTTAASILLIVEADLALP